MGRFHAFTNVNFVRLVERNTELELQNDELQQRARSLESQLYEARLVGGNRVKPPETPKPAKTNNAPAHPRRQSHLVNFAWVLVGISAVWFCAVVVISLLH